MTYLIEKNARRHRRNAKLMTALIMITLIATTAYFTGALDQVLLEWIHQGEVALPQAPVAAA
ncbi:hypothetical protein [Lewinella sp. 4G2]|uniref:hypothetical protein n=1 Tax=Lewinella sp. 4G2 TaxID=1803372 RepID=UPI0007B47950|nr:hypothetical protein [Lewinella sp. 4G2]OAV45341.1 hypothetical protein A3850_012940 [Lewinella sp. 4G2]